MMVQQPTSHLHRGDGIITDKSHEEPTDFQMRKQDGRRMCGSAQERKLRIKGMLLVQKSAFGT